MNKLWPILAAAAGVLVLVVGILLLTGGGNDTPTETTGTEAPPSTVEFKGQPRAALEQQFTALDAVVRGNVTLELSAAGETPETLRLTLTQAETGAKLDLSRLASDLDAGVGKEAADSFLLDPRDYLVLNETALRAAIDAFVAEHGSEFAVPVSKLDSVRPEDVSDGEEEAPDKILVVTTGTPGRGLEADKLYEAVAEALSTALIAESPEEVLTIRRSYELRPAEAVDVDALWERYCKDPVEPELNTSNGEVTDGADGYGFDREALEAALAAAEPGAELRVPLRILHPETDAATLRESLFQDVLGEAHTPHSAIYNRTNNLKLACAEINGTILLPGETFSFNKVVGERTEAKGYKEAIVYAGGGESKPEVGGGVCQVASSIYYATLQADLKTVQRAAHMFLVDYVPPGMDATIYWGQLDFKFENSSPYPIKIEASVSDGKVHIKLLGTEWKDYTVKLTYDILEKEDWEVVEKDVPNDGTYRKGEVITTPYTGYKVVTYKTCIDKETGEKTTTKIANSNYRKRDKVIANPVDDTQPTEPSSQPTEPTQPSSEPTEPSSQPTEPTQPSSEPTEPSSEPTEPSSEPTEPSSEPTEPSSEPTEPSSEPSEPEPEPEPDGGE